jgi:hypothetical protein
MDRELIYLDKRDTSASVARMAAAGMLAVRHEAAIYLGISPSTFDQLREAKVIGPAKLIGSRKLFDIRMLDDVFDALPHENHEAAEDWTAAV